MRRFLSLGLLSGLLSGLFAGCGGGGGGSCGKVKPCGGDLVGNWKVTDSCLTNSSLPTAGALCPAATANISDLKVSGTTTYNANKTYTGALTVSMSVKFQFPPSCLSANGVTLTCAQFSEALQAQFMAAPDAAIQSISCAPSGANCDCTAIATPQAQNESGTYITAGNVVTTTPTGEAASSDEYCVQGSELHIVSAAMTMGMGTMGDVTTSGDLVLTKQ